MNRGIAINAPTAQPQPTTVELALRCLPVLSAQEPRKQRRRRKPKPPEFLLVFDTETTPDAIQQLTFGSYLAYRRVPDADDPRTYECFEEGLIVADDAPADAAERLRAYVASHSVHESVENLRLQLLTQKGFVDLLYRAARWARAYVAGYNLPFDISRLALDAKEGRKGARGGFSLILATYSDRTTGERRPDTYRPRITIKTIDSKRSLKQFTRFDDDVQRISDDSFAEQPDKKYYFPGNFLELRTLAFSLTDRGLTLDGACEAFGVERKGDPGKHLGWAFDDEYIDYNRRDTRITAKLAVTMLREFARHPIDVAPVELFSPASIGKGYLDAMRISPPLLRWPDFPKAELGYAMSTFYGGRTSARIRRFLVPVRYCDFLSMYPTVNALLGTWDLLTAENCRVVDVTDRARATLEKLSLEKLFQPSIWPQLGFFAQIIPNGDIVPVRARWEAGDARQIGINPLTASQPLWYAGPDLAASILLSGKIPTIERAFAVEPICDANGRPIRLRGMRSVKLLDAIEVDPYRENFFTKVIEERQRARKDESLERNERDRLDTGLKVIANSSSYGIFAQMDAVDLHEGESAKVQVHGAFGAFETRSTKPERAGTYFFPPISALITAGARCMIAMLEKSVTDRGGTYAMEDTDSMAIVATPTGGLVPCASGPYELGRNRKPHLKPLLKAAKGRAIRALSFDEVDEIVERFALLNPYKRDDDKASILKVEEVNHDEHGQSRQLWCYAISSKRYALFTLDEGGEPHVARDKKGEPHCSEHGLGHLLNPVDVESDDRAWIVNAWEGIVCEHLALPIREPAWLDRPALTRLAITTPRLRRPFEPADKGLPYAQSVKPFNFLLAAHIAPFGFPACADLTHFLLVAPYEKDPKRWPKLPWVDVHSRAHFGITTDSSHRDYHPEKALVQTYRTTLSAFRLHPEAKSLRADGLPCDDLHKDYAGVLLRRPAVVPMDAFDEIGKEMNELEHVLAEVAHDEDSIVSRYHDRRRAPFDRYRILLRAIPKRFLVSKSGLSERSIENIRMGRSLPHPRNQQKLLAAIVDYFMGRPLPTYETIEKLDRSTVNAEVRSLADRLIKRATEAMTQTVALSLARMQIATFYEQTLAEALGLLGIA